MPARDDLCCSGKTGDGELLRIANPYANICQVGRRTDFANCFAMITTGVVKLMNIGSYGITVGPPADIAVPDGTEPAGAVAEIAQLIYSVKS